ncbi:MAG: DUF5681 domain-containing protein [Hyphomonadaceae bacterium]
MADNRRNLTGWPKKVEARHTLEKELEEKIPITIGGREMLVTKEEAVIRGTVNDAIRGDHRARKAVFDCIKARDARTQDGQEIAALYDTELMDQLYAEYEQQMREAAGQRETTGEDEPGGEDR